MYNPLQQDSLFFNKLSAIFQKQASQCSLVVLTHLIPNVHEYLVALKAIAQVKVIVGIPYSADQTVIDSLKREYNLALPTLSALFSENYLFDLVCRSIPKGEKFIIQEIGGYFSTLIHRFKEYYGDDFLGVVEDTEAGHKRYLMVGDLPCPVISVARSELKLAEDFLIGDSCLRATLHLLKKNSIAHENKNALVIGYGKIGRATAYAARKSGLKVSVYDFDSIKNLVACSEGFSVGNRETLISQSDFIFGTTANTSISLLKDAAYLKENACLISCSSKQLEFDLKGHIAERDTNHISKLSVAKKTLFLFAQGEPINFIGDFLIGPMIRVMHAELLASIVYLQKFSHFRGIITIPREQKELIAKVWLEHFLL